MYFENTKRCTYKTRVQWADGNRNVNVAYVSIFNVFDQITIISKVQGIAAFFLRIRLTQKLLVTFHVRCTDSTVSGSISITFIKIRTSANHANCRLCENLDSVFSQVLACPK